MNDSNHELAAKRTTKLTNIKPDKLKEWEEIHEYGKPGWIFRGMNDTSLALETALERNGWMRDGGISNLKTRERTLLREFQRRYSHYAHQIPLTDDTLEWLSIMQHHGAPTRLLDWSYSVYVAAYFALESAQEDCVVWGIRTEWIREELENRFKDKPGSLAFLTRPIEDNRKHRHDFEDLFMSNSQGRSFVAPLTPFRANERLTIQKGTFLVPSNLSKGFEDNLSDMTGHDDSSNIKKLVIPKAQRRIAIESLYYMNISRATLFPGIDGFSSSLGIYHPMLDATKGV